MATRVLPSAAFLRRHFIYRPDSGELIWRIGKKRGQRAGGLNCSGYRMVAIDGQQYMEHRIIWKIQTGSDPEFIDHVDGNRARNAWDNLRSGSRSQNMRNMRLNANNKSGAAGVKDCGDGIWVARIPIAGKLTHLGSFYSKAEAVAARKAAEICLGYAPTHGQPNRPRYSGNP